MKDEPADAPFGPVLRYWDRCRERYEAPSPRLSGPDGWIAAAMPEFHATAHALVHKFRMRERQLTERAQRAAALRKYQELRGARGEWRRGENESDQDLCLQACLAVGKIYVKADKAADYITRACVEARPPVPPSLYPRRIGGLKVPARVPVRS